MAIKFDQISHEHDIILFENQSNMINVEQQTVFCKKSCNNLSEIRDNQKMLIFHLGKEQKTLATNIFSLR